MNIFKLDDEVRVCAMYHCDKHVVKMIVEYAQLLSTAHHFWDGEGAVEGIYKKTHVNHPSAVWARTNVSNYRWLVRLEKCLLAEYEHRYHKIHKTNNVFALLKVPPKNIPKGKITELPQCMPDEYKHPNPVIGYRTYYRKEKASFATYKNRQPPIWMQLI